MYDYDPQKNAPTWQQFLERVHPEDRAESEQRAKMETTQKGWVDSQDDFRIVLPDGTIKHLHSIARPVMDESGQIAEVVGTVMDVTERKRAEALRDGESRVLEMIARDAPLGEILQKLVRVGEDHTTDFLRSVRHLDAPEQHILHSPNPHPPH